jgi:uncharacterized membrane protein (GlpM family)
MYLYPETKKGVGQNRTTLLGLFKSIKKLLAFLDFLFLFADQFTLRTFMSSLTFHHHNLA